MLKKLIIILTLFLASGCTSFGKGIAEAFLDSSKKTDTRACEVKGNTFDGINQAFEKTPTVKVLMIHGVGTHQPGYSTRIQENLIKELGLTVLSRRDKNITLINPSDGKTEIGNLRVSRMSNEDNSKDLIFYELTWSDITSLEKKILSYDVSGAYRHKRAAFNNSMKAFLDDVVPDPMIYLMDRDGLILNATKQSTCWMLTKTWNDLKQNQKGVCTISSYQQIKDLSHEDIIYLTHSLGSRILLDSISDIVNQVATLDYKDAPHAKPIIEELKNKEVTVFMMANQLPLLQISRNKPKVINQIDDYCTPKGKNYDNRVYKKVKIIAFSDPNDLLSYDIPQSFVDEYIDSRMCPSVTNVSLNIAEIISAFGVGVVNPVTAHTEYDNDARVVRMISHGTSNYKNDDILSQRCNFIRLSKD